MADEHYNLRWNNHQPNFITVFQSLLELEELVDVTLSVEGKQIKAHKIILSACSPYFKMLFQTANCKHPIVILDDIKFVDLKTIVDFMYLGEINVRDEKLADILEVAEALQILGLFDPNKKENLSSYRKSCENSTKKRKKKSKTVEGDSSSPNATEATSSQELGDCRTTESPMDTMVHPTDWLEINHQSYDSDGHKVRCSSDQNFGSTVNNSNYENSKYSYSNEKPEPNTSPFFNSFGTGPNYVRKRNSKVQGTENFSLALEAVRSGTLGFCKAAKIYGINNRTLWLEYKKRGYPTLRPPVNAKHKNNTLPSTSS